MKKLQGEVQEMQPELVAVMRGCISNSYQIDPVFVNQGSFLYTPGRTGNDKAKFFLFELPFYRSLANHLL